MPSSKFSQIISWTVIAVFFLSILLFLPFFSEYYQIGKFVTLIVGMLILLVLWSVKTMITGAIDIPNPKIIAGFGVLFLASLISLFTNTSNKVEALINPTAGAVIFGGLNLILLFADTQLDDKMRQIARWSLYILASLMSIISIYMFFGIGKLMFPGVAYLVEPLWNPLGSSLMLVTIIVITIPLALEEAVIQVKKHHEVGIPAAIIMSILLIASLGLSVYQIVPKLNTMLLPIGAAWSILLEMYKSFRFALFGVGTDNFINAFSAGRPSALNLGPVWNLRFTTSASTILHIATTLGLLGLSGIGILIWSLISTILKNPGWGTRISVIFVIISLFIAPPHIAVWLLIAFLLIILNSKNESRVWQVPSHIIWIASATCFTGIILTLVGGYFFYRYIAGESIFFQSIEAAQANNGTKTYNLQIKAIQQNPNMSNYHVVYSQTNLALANNITLQTKTATGTGELSADDRNLVTQLIQQSIREAKIATTLSPSSIIAWENLAQIYQSIGGIVNGADQWAIAAFQQALQIDPTNPMLRMDLAGLYLRTQNIDNAVSQLQVAVALKPDLSNVHYNLAYAYSLTKQYFKQAVALKQTLALVPENGEDYKKVKTELDKLLPLLTKDDVSALIAVKTGSANVDQIPLAPPENKSETDGLKPKIELPESASPSARVSESSAAAVPKMLQP
jgi:tetratricopeptide (TPR) repeat protein